MDILLEFGLLLVVGYWAGWLLHLVRLPKVIGYIGTGIFFSPHTLPLIGEDFVIRTEPLLEICLAFIAFEVGGALRWSRIRRHEREIVGITLYASLMPFLFVVSGVVIFGWLLPAFLPHFSFGVLLLLALQLGALASPTAPAATLAVMHEYKAHGKVTDTIIGVVSLDDTLGIVLFSGVINLEVFFMGSQGGMMANVFAIVLFQIVGALVLGVAMAFVMMGAFRWLPKKEEGQWIVVIASLLIVCLGLCKLLHLEELLACMTMGIFVVNGSRFHHRIFKVIERYTEDLVFLFFFILSGLHLDVGALPVAIPLVVVFVGLRIVGKYLGCYLGARWAHAPYSIRHYTAGGLIPQAGIVIGLVLNVYQMEEFAEISEVLLAVVMGATIVNELIGPVMARHALVKAGEIR